MSSFKILGLLAVLTLLFVATEARSRSGKPRSSSSGSGDDFWFWAYTFSNSDWKDTPMSMEEFAQENVQIMWQNRPAHAQAATCIQGPWTVKDYDKVSPAMRVTYFTHGGFLKASKKVRIFDCLYIWGPGQQLYSEDDVKSDRMSIALDDSKCSLDNATMDISCF